MKTSVLESIFGLGYFLQMLFCSCNKRESKEVFEKLFKLIMKMIVNDYTSKFRMYLVSPSNRKVRFDYLSEAVIQKCSAQKMLEKIWKNSHEKPLSESLFFK